MSSKKMIDFLNTVIPFLSQYPFWVHALVAIWILLSCIIIIGFLFARLPDADLKNIKTVPKGVSSSSKNLSE
jgi:hypothetical protein